MKDICGDEIVLSHFANVVDLTVCDGGDFATAALSPKKARKLAKKLIKAAAEIEANSD